MAFLAPTPTVAASMQAAALSGPPTAMRGPAPGPLPISGNLLPNPMTALAIAIRTKGHILDLVI